MVPFSDDLKYPAVHLGTEVSTGEGDTSATVEGFDYPVSRFHAKTLLRALEVATEIDLSRYPKPCPFEDGQGLQGVVMGIKQV